MEALGGQDPASAGALGSSTLPAYRRHSVNAHQAKERWAWKEGMAVGGQGHNEEFPSKLRSRSDGRETHTSRGKEGPLKDARPVLSQNAENPSPELWDRPVDGGVALRETSPKTLVSLHSQPGFV